MAGEEKKLGPQVTYLGQGEDDKTPVTVAGQLVMPGDSIEVEDQAALKALAGNRYFQVAGGPDHKADQEKRDKLKAEQEQKLHKAQEEQRKQQEHPHGGPPGQNKPQPKEAPESYQGPDEAELERQPPRRK